jgi:hypothetical protein
MAGLSRQTIPAENRARRRGTAQQTAHFTTEFTSRPGTTIALTTFLPANSYATFASASPCWQEGTWRKMDGTLFRVECRQEVIEIIAV